MSWYDDAWRNRWPVCTPNTGGTSDLTLTIPSNWDEFWDNVKDTTNGHDIIICDIDGETLLTYQLQTFNYATRSCVIEVDNYSYNAGEQFVLWVYWDKDTPSDLQTTFTAGTTHTLQIALYDPESSWWNFEFTPERPGATQPQDEIAKNSSDRLRVWIRIPSGASGERLTSSEGSKSYDEIGIFEADVLQGGASQAAMIDDSKNVVCLDSEGSTWVGMWIKAGTDANDYTGSLWINTAHSLTSGGGILYKTFLIRVNDPAE